jgi:small multidrug resistance pump
MLMLSTPQAWLVLSAAIGLEVAGTVCMRLSDGLTRLTPTVCMLLFYAFAFLLNTLVVRVLGLSVTYAVWSGVGTVLTAIIGIWYFKEPATAVKMVSIGLIVIGVMGLHSSARLANP